MEFNLSIHIERSPLTVFQFLRDKDKYPQEPGSAVLLLDKITAGPPGVGTRYRELVRMMPGVKGEFLSEITHYESGVRLDEEWAGAGMKGRLSYRFIAEGNGTRLVQQESVEPQGLLTILAPLVQLVLGRAIEQRLQDIKHILESGWQPENSQ